MTARIVLLRRITTDRGNGMSTTTSEDTLTDAEIAAVVFASGHMSADGTGGRALKYHLLTCPTCSASAKLTAHIVAARVAEALAPIEAELKQAEEGAGIWGTCSGEWVRLERLRAALPAPEPT